jgi:SOS-response transcriptional repressor LexA
MAVSLTTQQRRTYEYVRGYIYVHGIGPSLDDIKDALGLKSKSGVNRLLCALEERGLIKRLYRRPRAIEVLADMPKKISARELADGVCEVLAKCLGDGPSSAMTQIMVREYIKDFFAGAK